MVMAVALPFRCSFWAPLLAACVLIASGIPRFTLAFTPIPAQVASTPGVSPECVLGSRVIKIQEGANFPVQIRFGRFFFLNRPCILRDSGDLDCKQELDEYTSACESDLGGFVALLSMEGFKNNVPLKRVTYQCYSDECSLDDVKLVETRRLQLEENIGGITLDVVPSSGAVRLMPRLFSPVVGLVVALSVWLVNKA